ncbi:MAG: glycoside hydrolase family 31 protein, partial [Parabacteroides sp.]|nr:glycoside hydrolase family 31 protein [Parabacteroides sp.]
HIRAMNLEAGFTAKEQIQKGEWDSTENPYEMAIKKESKNQFMAGDYLLVAPMFAGEKERDVILPQGKWFDFYSGEYVGNGEIITVKPHMDRIPLFVKDGGIIPLWPAITKVDEKKYPLEIRHYGSKPGSYKLYDDDGKTYNYEKGEYTYLTFTVDVDDKGQKKGSVSIPEGKQVWSYNGEYNFRFMTK